jgi:DHA1 family bicyclomycin/chloramphenicol resistance-like MFS transporter
VLLVTALMAMTALGIDLMLPAFPKIRHEFGMSADSTRVAWIVTAYFLGMAIGPWLYGPASDRFGRRRPLYAGLVLYAGAATLAAVAPSWPLVVVARVLWGIGASGPRSLAVAMIRDRHEGDEMAKLMSLIMAVFLLVPIVAPGLGALLSSVFPWRAVFWFPAIVAVLLMIWARRLPETLALDKRRPFTWRAVGAAAREVVSNRQTMTLTVSMTFLFGVMTIYLSGTEVIFSSVYHYGSWFPLFFGLVGVLLASNSFNNARLIGRFGATTLVRVASVLGLITAAVLTVVATVGGGRPNFWLFAVVLALLIPICQGLTPPSNTIAMTPLPHVAGTASALIATFTSAGGALLGNLGTSAIHGSVSPFAVFLLIYVAAATVLTLWGTARPVQSIAEPAPATLHI